jgi:hypothetical protein
MMRDTSESAFSRICAGTELWKMRLGESARVGARKLVGNSLYDRFRALLLGGHKRMP